MLASWCEALEALSMLGTKSEWLVSVAHLHQQHPEGTRLDSGAE
jgi:hypothetical protein